MAVASDGTVEAFWTENSDSKGKYPDTQVVATSKDGGATFSALISTGTPTDYPMTGTPFDVVDLLNRSPSTGRTAVYAGSKSAVAPNPDTACAGAFGDTDTVSAAVAY